MAANAHGQEEELAQTILSGVLVSNADVVLEVSGGGHVAC